ncbi:RDD family protein [Thalassolituus sp. LLYu03]|uniref:RDD family protein n=1 Tax=Thalassolituus sp. LLYu03 TaxID=3421656 RepID=UPI003D279E3F
MSAQNYPTANLLRRLAALVYDGLIVIALYIAVGFVVVGLLKASTGEFPGALPWSVSASLLFTVSFLYYSHSWRKGGQTVGMKAWRIRLISEEKGPVRLSQCMLRSGIGFFSLLAAGLGYWWMLFDKRQRTWHDMASLTRVVFLPKNMD